MGRITIFTDEKCNDSTLLRSLLSNHTIPYDEISLSVYPERRSDMIFLSNELSTPQVFFNSLHVGGVLEVQKLFGIYTQEVAAAQVVKVSSSSQQQSPKSHESSSLSTPSSSSNPPSSSSNPPSSSSSSQSVLDRIKTSVLNQPSPTHEPKLRIPSRQNVNHYQQSIQFEYDSWVERMKASDIFHLSHEHGQEKLSIQDITRTLVRIAPMTTIYCFKKNKVQKNKNCIRGKHLIPILQEEYPFLLNSSNDLAIYPTSESSSCSRSRSSTEDDGHVLSAVADGSFSGSVTMIIDNTTQMPQKKKSNNSNTKTNQKQLQDTIAFGQTLLQLGILHSIYNDDDSSSTATTTKKKHKEKDKFTPNGIYRLQPYQSPNIMNKFHLWNKICVVDGNDPQPLLTLSNLTRMLNEAITTATIQNDNNNNNSASLDWNAIQQSDIFQSFEENICLLQLTNLDDMHERSRLVFFINLHNLMMKHAIIEQQCDPSSSSSYSEKKFYSKLKYMIGDYTFSLDEIYHGILRCNAKHPKTGEYMFSSKNDPRSKFKCATINPRIHFALLCNYWDGGGIIDSGTSSSSYSSYREHYLNLFHTYEFHQEAMIGELFIVSQRSCKSDDRICIDEKKNILFLPKFIRMYLDDFTLHWKAIRMDNYLPRAMSKYLVGEKREVLTEMLRKQTIGTSFSSLPSNSISLSNNKKNQYIKVIFRDNMTSIWMNCCSSLQYGRGSASSMKSYYSKDFGGFPQAIPEDELSLLQNENNDFIQPELSEPIEADCISRSSSSLRGLFMGSNWDMMSSESSWNLDIEIFWQKLDSNSFEKTGWRKKRHSTPKPANGKKKNTNNFMDQSPSTIKTVSTISGSPSVSNDSDDVLSRVSNKLVLPEFKDDKNFDQDSNNNHSCYSNTEDGFSYDNSSYCSDPPKALRVGKEGLLKKEQSDEGEDKKIVSTKKIINLFFPPTEILEGDEDEKSYDLDNDDWNSYNSQSHNEDSLGGSLLFSNDSQFEKLFDSSMASI